MPEARLDMMFFSRSAEMIGGSCNFHPGGMMPKVNLAEKFAMFKEPWNSKVVAELNGQYVKLVKLQGEFVWHCHEAEDELFLAVKGRFSMHFRNKVEEIEEGEFVIVPAGVEHKPVAEEEAHVLLFEPKSTLNSGNIRNELTHDKLESL